MDEGDLVVVASPRRIEAEWRTVVVGRRVVAASRYKSGGRRNVDGDVPDEVLAFARSVAAEIDLPAPATMLDVAREEGGRLCVVELNSFSCSELYACYPLPVVRAVHAFFAE